MNYIFKYLESAKRQSLRSYLPALYAVWRVLQNETDCGESNPNVLGVLNIVLGIFPYNKSTCLQ